MIDNDTIGEADKTKNSDLSLCLMAFNLLLAFILAFTTQPSGSDAAVLGFVIVLSLFLVMLGLFVVAYAANVITGQNGFLG